MKKTMIFFFFGMACFTSLNAQTTAVDSVKNVINHMFTAMRNSDGAVLSECFADSAVLQTIAKDAQGQPLVKSEKISAFVTAVAGMPKNAADEQIVFDMVKTDGPLATAWTPYRFFYNGKFSHCGVNSFQLVRLNGQWKIQYIIDTRRKQGCE